MHPLSSIRLLTSWQTNGLARSAASVSGSAFPVRIRVPLPIHRVPPSRKSTGVSSLSNASAVRKVGSGSVSIALSAIGSAVSSPNFLGMVERSSSRHRVQNARGSGFPASASIETDSGTSRRIVASIFDSSADSLPSRSFLPTEGENSLYLSSLYNVSRLPAVWMSFSAVFSPIPGTPGMLSDVSPISALTSTNCAGVIPYSSKKRSGV